MSSSYWSLLQKIRDSPPPSLPDDWPYSKEMRDFVDSCLRSNPEDRPSCRQLLRHQFIRKASPLASDDEALSKNRDDHLRSISELHAIVLAIFAHVKLLVTSKKYMMIKVDFLTAENKEETERIFGESIVDVDAVIILQKILFGKIFVRIPSANFKLPPSAVPTARKRLKMLAHQLYMPLEMLQQEVENFYGGLIQEEFKSNNSNFRVQHSELINLDD
eukprot:gene22012-28496_t